MTQTVVVGLDGASWDLIDSWVEDGTLPTIQSLRRDGTWSTSRSCLPPVTFPNWKCYAASKNPGNLGVFWFEYIDFDAENIEIMSGANFQTAELWDYLNEEGMETGVVNMPTMYPPRTIDGYVVAGGPDAVDGEYRSIDSGYTYPPEFESEIESKFDYVVHPDPLISSNEETEAEVQAIIELLHLRFDVVEYLLQEEDMDFVHVTLFYLNVLQHFFWNEWPVKAAWELIDERLDQLVAGEDRNIVLMSDHGCGPVDTEFYINEWLAAEGYLTKETTIEDVFQRVGLNRENALQLAKRLGLVNLLATYLPKSIQELVPQEAGIKRGRKLEKIVIEETRALASGQGPVYLNPDFDIEILQEDLITALEAATDEGGNPLFDGVYRANEVYTGSYLDRAPAVNVDQRAGVTVNDGMGGGCVYAEPKKWAAENTRQGIFVASGPDFTAEGNLGKTSILDIAPTVLGALGIDAPTDMEGEVLPTLARDESTIGEQVPLSIDSAGLRDKTSEEVEDRLTQLGYME